MVANSLFACFAGLEALQEDDIYTLKAAIFDILLFHLVTMAVKMSFQLLC